MVQGSNHEDYVDDDDDDDNNGENQWAPGDLSQFSLNSKGTAINPLKGVHVRVQHLVSIVFFSFSAQIYFLFSPKTIVSILFALY